jgi:hypothetical protein
MVTLTYSYAQSSMAILPNDSPCRSGTGLKLTSPAARAPRLSRRSEDGHDESFRVFVSYIGSAPPFSTFATRKNHASRSLCYSYSLGPSRTDSETSGATRTSSCKAIPGLSRCASVAVRREQSQASLETSQSSTCYWSYSMRSFGNN